MNPCQKTSLLTAYLLGELPADEAAEMRAHLEACPSCGAAADELRATLDLLRATLAPEERPAMRLDNARRQRLLDVQPERANWFLRRHTLLLKAAAVLVVGGGLFGVLSSVMIRPVALRQGGSPDEYAVMTLGNGIVAEKLAGATAAARSAGDADSDAGAAYAKRGASVKRPAAKSGVAAPSLGDPSPAAAAKSERYYREGQAKCEELNFNYRADAASGPAASAPTAAKPFSPQPAAFDAVVAVKSPITMKGVYASRSPGSRAAVYAYGGGGGSAGRALDEKPAASAPESDVAVEFVGGELAKDSKQDAAVPEGKTRLKIELPKPQSAGTPKDVRSSNLEPARDQLEERVETARLGVDRAKTVVTAGEKKLAWGLQSEVAVNRPEEARKAKESEREPAAVAWVEAGGARPRSDVSGAAAFNPFKDTGAEPFSTFAIDVDTASYTLTRQAIRAGAVPAPETVRTEEIVNALDYGDAAPEHTVFRVYQEGAQSQFGAGYHLLRIGVKGRRLGREEQRPAMLTFVIDVSGSMSQPDRIGLARTALRLLVGQLSERDRIQIIAYSDHAQVVLDPVAATEKDRIIAAFERLQCNGSTNLEEGLRRAYERAAGSFMPGAENRVILISDGVANLGADSAQDILDKVAAFRRQGITCSVFGVGSGTYNDRMLEGLANKGDGVYRFLDNDDAVRSAFVEDLAATLNTIAKDAKIQVEWNPAVVRRYRQLGYENRALAKEQFRDDAVDAGEVGSGQSVTALYELELASDVAPEARLGTVRVRYQRTDTGKVEEIETALVAESVLRPARAASAHFRVAACAAEFAELLRGSPYAAGGSYQAVADYLRPAALELSLDTRVKELLDLVTIMAAKQK